MMLGARVGAWANSGGVDYGGRTVFDVTVDPGDTYSFYTLQAPSGTLIDWGDGTVDSLKSHVYATGGDYTIAVGREATYIRFGFGNSKLASAITRFWNFGENISSIFVMFYGCNNLKSVVTQSSPRLGTSGQTNDNRGFYGCESLESVKFNDYMLEDQTCATQMFGNCYSIRELVLGKGAFVRAVSLDDFVRNAQSLTKLKIPSGFASREEAVGNPFTGSAIEYLELPDGAFTHYVANATWNGGVGNAVVGMKEFKAGDGFGTHAKNLAYFLAHNNNTTIKRVSLPSGFGAEATNTNHLFYGLYGLTDLEMHGYANGIPISFDLHFSPLTVESAISVIRTLPLVSSLQTLTLKSSERQNYESSHSFVDERDAAVSRGWAISYT